MSITTIDPSTGSPIETYDWMTEAEVEERLRRAAAAFQRHRASSFARRAAALVRLADRLEERTRPLAEVMTREMGKPIGQAEAEVTKCAWVCRYYAEHAAVFLAPEPVATEAAGSYIAYQPLGPILAIMPWNFPFWQVFRHAAPALMAGNVVLLKHAPNVTGCALVLESLFQEAGFDDGIFQVLLVDVDTVPALVEDPRVAAATLTGSVGAGRAVGKLAGQAIKPSVLELGGSDAFIVLADADLDRALAAGLTSRMQNNGQSCIAAKRFILERPIAEAFAERFVRRVEALSVGDPMDPETDIGPLARADLRDQLHAQVQQTVAEGAALLTGGHPLDRPGFFYAPTVLGGVKPGMTPFREELFGPVASLIVADDADHAVALANDVPFGLGGAVFTRNVERGERLALRLEVGCAFVNEMVKSDPRLPFGGIKASGYGRELGRAGLRAFVNVKTVWLGS
ncbi:MAG: NAD-dependent succinate-semialdehyde dehydrogenase [Bacteroidetes bacterium]|nr:MAG: NAD-dependent succinate-semialdehyde dehydrogenase [Bacteroidota bacterium]